MLFTLFISYFVLLSVNIIAFVYIYLKSKGNYKTAKTISFYLIFMATNEIVSSILSFKGINNLFLSHSFIIIHALILGYLFIKHFLNNNQIKMAKIYLIISLSFLCFQYLTTPSLSNQFNIVEVFLMNYFLILCSFCYFYNTLGKTRQYNYLVLGILIYSILSTSIFLFANLAISLDVNLAKIIWSTHLVLLLTYQILLTFQWTSMKLIKINEK